MIPEDNHQPVDYFNQPITTKSKLLVPINGRIRLCSVLKINSKSIVVKQVNYETTKEIRIIPTDTVALTDEDLTCLTLRKGLR